MHTFGQGRDEMVSANLHKKDSNFVFNHFKLQEQHISLAIPIIYAVIIRECVYICHETAQNEEPEANFVVHRFDKYATREYQCGYDSLVKIYFYLIYGNFSVPAFHIQ